MNTLGMSFLKRFWLIVFGLLVLTACSKDSAQNHKLEASPTISSGPSSNVFDVRTFGAVGDNVHDDTAAINAANTAAENALGEVWFPTPSVCYKVTSELPIHWSRAHWAGQAQNFTQQTLCASGGPFRSVVEVRSTFGEGPAATPGPIDNAPSRGLLEDITINAGSGVARMGLLRDGDEYFRYRNVHVIDAVEHGIRNAAAILPATFGSVVVGGTGGSPTTGMSFTQADPNYLLGTIFPLSSAGPQTVNFVIRIVNPGALGTATYQISFDGGSTYVSGSWLLQPTFAIPNSNANGTQATTGILGHFPAGPYVAGTTYAIAITTQVADIDQAEAANDSTVFDTMTVAQNGTTYATSGLIGTYGGFTFTETATGTVTTVAGSNLIVGSGTAFLTGLQGCSYGRGAIKVGGNFYAIAAVLDDFDIATVDSTPVTTSGSGLDYAISCDAGYYEDGANESAYNQWFDGTFGQNSIAMVLGYERGPNIVGLHNNSSAIAGFILGGPVDDQLVDTTMTSVHTASGAFGAHGMPYIISSHTSGTMIDPIGIFTFAGAPGSWNYIQGGSIGAIAPYGNAIYGNMQSESFNYQPIAIPSAATQIAAPDLTAPSALGNSSYVRLQLAGTFTMTGTPVVLPTTNPGTILFIENGSLFQTVTFRDDADTSSGLLLEAAYVALQYQDVLVLMSGGPPPLFAKWKELYVARHYQPAGQGTLGDLGQGVNRVQTVSSTTPVPIYCLNTTLPISTAMKWDLIATSGSGVNAAKWLDNSAGWIPAGTQWGLVLGTPTGTGAGSTVPLGWAMSVDGNTTAPCVRVAGDSSANPVTWTIIVNHRDMGQ